MIIVYILFGLFIIIGAIAIFAIITLDNIQEYAIRINEAEANIESTLNKRFDLLNKSTDIIKTVTNQEEEVLDTIVEIRSSKLNNFDLDKELYKVIEEFHSYAEKNPSLKDNDDYTKIEIDLIESESEIIALKNYYNDIVKKYNDITTKSPTSIIAKIKKYNPKEEFKIEDHLELINSLK